MHQFDRMDADGVVNMLRQSSVDDGSEDIDVVVRELPGRLISGVIGVDGAWLAIVVVDTDAVAVSNLAGNSAE